MSNDELLKLDNQLCFLLYACSRGVTRTYRPLLAELDITYPQYLVMLVLWEEDGPSIKSLGRRLYLDSGTLTPLLKRLEASGLIVRKRSSEDERIVKVFLTDKGKAMKERACAIPEALLCQSGLSGEEFVGLKSLLETLLERLRNFEANGKDCRDIMQSFKSEKA
ncbi:transcriptional regulator, MarR family [Desulfatibacillum aliphaticivorans]|uniref:HTH-type transcriptional regulator SarZ n=1 Tax=Desulfatibacillum aliphaticivorans TaxID=218208 RepID=B8FGX4_DESAL|nr:MarR family transcriptional regulator [Desulfatibacillum aliphaticivorans]ACL05354.1 transcriptional regulator, MarR family [Desulfatibacillum aliphaticivorans]